MAAGVRDDVSRNYTCFMRRGEDNVFMDVSYTLVAACCPCLQMRHDHSGKRIIAGLQGVPACRIVPQFDYRKFDADATTPQALLIACRPPGWAGITQHRQAHHGAVVVVEEIGTEVIVHNPKTNRD